MNLNLTKLQYLFIHPQDCDKTIILKDGKNRTKLVGIHSLVVTISECKYFNDLLTLGKEKTEKEIPMNVENIYIAYDFIAKYFYGIESNSGNYSDWKHFLKSLTFYDFIQMKMDKKKYETINIPSEGYATLISITDQLDYPNDLIKLLNRCLPNKYDFSQIPKEICQKLMCSAFNECLYFISGCRTFPSDPIDPSVSKIVTYTNVKKINGNSIIYKKNYIPYIVLNVTKKIILQKYIYGVRQKYEKFIIHHFDTGKVQRYVTPKYATGINFSGNCKIAAYTIYNDPNIFEMIFEDTITNKILYKQTGTLCKYTDSLIYKNRTQYSIPTNCENVLFISENDDVCIVNIAMNTKFYVKIFKLRLIIASSNGKSFLFAKENEKNNRIFGMYDITKNCIVSESIFDVKNFYYENDLVVYFDNVNEKILKVWDPTKNEHFEVGITTEKIIEMKPLDGKNLFCTRDSKNELKVWNIHSRKLMVSFTQEESFCINCLNHHISMMIGKLLDVMTELCEV